MTDRISPEVATAYLVLSVILLALNSLAWNCVKAALMLVNFGILLSRYAHDDADLWFLIQQMVVVLICLGGIFFLVTRLFGIGSSSDEEHFVYNRRTRKLKRKSWW